MVPSKRRKPLLFNWHYTSEGVLNHTAMKTSEFAGIKACKEWTDRKVLSVQW